MAQSVATHRQAFRGSTCVIARQGTRSHFATAIHNELTCRATTVYGVPVTAGIPPEAHRVPTFVV